MVASASSRRFDIRPAILLTGAALLFAATESAERVLTHRTWEDVAGFGGVFLGVLPPWLIRAALAPLVGRLVRRFDFGGTRFLRSLAVHSIAGAVFSILHLALFAAWLQLTWHDPYPYWIGLLNLLSAYFAANIVIYWAITGGYLAFEYYRTLQRRERTSLELKASLAEARLHALRGQLQPHFLFNSLNTVTMLIREGLHEQAIETVCELGELLRRLLRDVAENEIPLGEEIEFVRRYLGVEQNALR